MVTHKDNFWSFSYAACQGEPCLEGRLTECKRFKDHVVKDAYVSTQSQKTQSQAIQNQSILSSISKAGSNLLQGAKDKIQPRRTQEEKTQEDMFAALYQNEPNIFEGDYDHTYSLTENESDSEEPEQDNRGLELVVRCPYSDDQQQSVCDSVPVDDDLLQFKAVGKAYCVYEIVKKYIDALKNSRFNSNTTVIMSQSDLDEIQADTNDLTCNARKRHQRIMQNPEMQKLTALDSDTKVQLVIVLFGHKNMKQLHTLNHGHYHDIYQKPGQTTGIQRPKRESAGHFM